jgi:dTDP-4-dehydrorhamnose 3,5-epimerase
MIFSETKISGVYVIDVERRRDGRGFFARTWCERELQENGLTNSVVQENVAFSHKQGCVRGMHFQLFPHEEVKIVRCTMGAVYDVAIDLRPDSPTHKKWMAVELTADNHRMVYIPEGCAHGYQTLVDNSEICYQTSRFYAPDVARGVRYNDPAFSVDWPLPVQVISEADSSWPDYVANLELSSGRTRS